MIQHGGTKGWLQPFYVCWIRSASVLLRPVQPSAWGSLHPSLLPPAPWASRVRPGWRWCVFRHSHIPATWRGRGLIKTLCLHPPAEVSTWPHLSLRLCLVATIAGWGAMAAPGLTDLRGCSDLGTRGRGKGTGAGTKHPLASGILILAKKKRTKQAKLLAPTCFLATCPLLSPTSLPRLSSWMPGPPSHGADRP